MWPKHALRIGYWLGIIILVGMVPIAPLFSAPPTPAKRPLQPPQVIQSDASGIVLQIEVPQPDLQEVTVAGERFQSVSLPGFHTLGEPGGPALPQKILTLGVPYGRPLAIEVIPLEVETLKAPLRPAPMPAEVAVYPDGADPSDPLVLPQSVAPAPHFDPHHYKGQGWFPAQQATLTPVGLFRDQPFVQVVYHPIQVNHQTGEARILRQAQLRLTFGPPPADQSATEGHPAPDPYFDTLRETFLLNGPAAHQWRLPSSPTRHPQQHPGAAPLTAPRWRITVDQPGIYRLTRAQLEAAGVTPDVLQPSAFRLERAAPTPMVVPVALLVGTDGLVQSADFYVAEVGSRWSTQRVYWLTTGTPSPAMAVRSAAPIGGALTTAGLAQVQVNQPLVYGSTYIGLNEGDPWFGERVLAGSQPVRATAFDLTPPAPQPHLATLSVRLMGGRAGRHQIQLSINNTDVGPLQTWMNKTLHRATITFPGSLLQPGRNELTLSIPTGDSNTYVLLDSFHITHQRTLNAVNQRIDFALAAGGGQDLRVAGLSGVDVVALDVTNPDAPIALTDLLPTGNAVTFRATGPAGTPYALTTAPQTPAISIGEPATLRDPSNGADYILVTHPDFQAAVAPLRQFHQARGLRVAVVTTAQIYAEFGDGTPHPQWIRNFLDHAYHLWAAPRPAFVLLVGDSTFDPLHHLGFSTADYVPAHLGHYDIYIGETSSDNRYVTVSGDDNVPDIHIGRLPANSAAQATAMVNKVLSYAAGRIPLGQSTPEDHWTRNIFLVTDNYPDSAGNFYELSDNVAEEFFPATVVQHQMYAGIDVCAGLECSTEAQNRVISGINTGNLAVQYIGHAEKRMWAFNPLIFQVSNLSALTNTELPILLPWTCWTGYFINPDPRYYSLDEEMLRLPTAGAVASFSPTGLDVAVGHDYMTRGFYKALFHQHQSQVGPLTLAAKLELCATATTCTGSSHVGRVSRLVDTYMLLGDPALVLNVPGCLLFQGDVNCNCQVDLIDIQAVAGDWRRTEGFNPRHDLSGDGQITSLDIQIAAREWGQSCTTH